MSYICNLKKYLGVIHLQSLKTSELSKQMQRQLLWPYCAFKKFFPGTFRSNSVYRSKRTHFLPLFDLPPSIITVSPSICRPSGIRRMPRQSERAREHGDWKERWNIICHQAESFRISLTLFPGSRLCSFSSVFFEMSQNAYHWWLIRI